MLAITIFVLIIVLATGYNFFSNQSAKKDNAYTWAFKACDTISAQQSANYAALANSLDGKWLRLSDAANALAGFEVLSKEFSKSPRVVGNEVGSINYQRYLMNAQFVAECNLTFKKPKSE